jgi:hypothetical protein
MESASGAPQEVCASSPTNRYAIFKERLHVDGEIAIEKPQEFPLHCIEFCEGHPIASDEKPLTIGNPQSVVIEELCCTHPCNEDHATCI